jgi:hypothetical protein
VPDKRKKMRVSVDIEGDISAAFLDELGKRVAAGGSPSKADMGRVLITEALQARGHKVEIPETVWGGFHLQEDDKQGQWAGAGA